MKLCRKKERKKKGEEEVIRTGRDNSDHCEHECGGTHSWQHHQSQKEPRDINQLYHRDSDNFERWQNSACHWNSHGMWGSAGL